MEETWEVQAVMDKRTNPVTGNIEYLLKWKNWAGSPTWEPEDNCDCTILIARFEKQLLQRQSSSQPSTPGLGEAVKQPQRKRKRRKKVSTQPVNTCLSLACPRSKSPLEQEPCCDSSCSEASLIDDPCDRRVRERKLRLKEIIGAVNDKETQFIVKWHGIADLEKVPLKVLRRFYCQDILDFLLLKLKWIS